MTDLRAAAQQALGAMDKATRFMSDSEYRNLNKCIEDLKTALSEPPINHCGEESTRNRRTAMTFEQSASKVIQWARDREIIPNSTPMAQAIKTAEEVTELLKALNSNNHKEVVDAYGDIVVTLLVGSELYGVRLEGCLETAYQVIKDRKGTLGPDGIFRKES